MGTSPDGRSSASRDEARHGLKYARRQQYRRLSGTAMAAMGSGASVLLALAVADAGAVSAAGAILVLAVGLGLYARHCCRSPSAAALVLARRTRSGTRLRGFRGRGGGCGTPYRGAGVGTSTRWRSRRPASPSWSRPRRGRTTIATSVGCASRRRGRLVGGDGGVGAARCRWYAWFARMVSSGWSTACWSCRSIG